MTEKTKEQIQAHIKERELWHIQNIAEIEDDDTMVIPLSQTDYLLDLYVAGKLTLAHIKDSSATIYEIVKDDDDVQVVLSAYMKTLI